MIAKYAPYLKRLLLFQFFFVFAYFKFSNISKSSYEFKDRIYEISKFFNYRSPVIDQLFSNPIPLFQVFVLIQLFSAILAVLGNKVFSFVSGLLLLVSSVIYYGPLRSKQGGVSGKFLLESFSMEFMMTLALVLAIFAQSLNDSCKKEIESKETEKSKSEESKKLCKTEESKNEKNKSEEPKSEKSMNEVPKIDERETKQKSQSKGKKKQI